MEFFQKINYFDPLQSLDYSWELWGEKLEMSKVIPPYQLQSHIHQRVACCHKLIEFLYKNVLGWNSFSGSFWNCLHKRWLKAEKVKKKNDATRLNHHICRIFFTIWLTNQISGKTQNLEMRLLLLSPLRFKKTAVSLWISWGSKISIVFPRYIDFQI